MKANSVAKLAKLQSEVADGACCVGNGLKEVKYKCSCCSQVSCKLITSETLSMCSQFKLRLF